MQWHGRQAVPAFHLKMAALLPEAHKPQCAESLNDLAGGYNREFRHEL